MRSAYHADRQGIGRTAELSVRILHETVRAIERLLITLISIHFRGIQPPATRGESPTRPHCIYGAFYALRGLKCRAVGDGHEAKSLERWETPPNSQPVIPLAVCDFGAGYERAILLHFLPHEACGTFVAARVFGTASGISNVMNLGS